MSSGIDGLEFTGSSLLRDALSTVKSGGSKEFVVKEFVVEVKDLLVSLWGMKVAYKEEARGIG